MAPWRERGRAARLAGTWPASVWRAGVVAVLLGVAAAGLRARGVFSHTPDSTAAGLTSGALAIVLPVAEGIAIVAFLVVLAFARRDRDETDDEDALFPLPRVPLWVKVAGVLLSLAAIAAPLVIVLSSRKVVPGTPPPPPRSRAAPGPLAGGHPVAPPRIDAIWLAGAGLVTGLVAVLVLAVLVRRHLRATAADAERARKEDGLAAGLTAAAGALASADDPRAAIVACYTALEHGFATAGSAPASADTPAEVLTRATAAGLVRSGSAEVLTGLFRQARYGNRPMTAADSGAAATALSRMRADLEHR